MPKLSEQIDFVVGVDTHKASHTAAVVSPQGAELATRTLPADAFGYRRLLALARTHAAGRRVWAVEGSGSFGSGLTTYLLEHSEWVVEVDRPKRPARRNGAKSDELDARRAAREALSRKHLAQPGGGVCERPSGSCSGLDRLRFGHAAGPSANSRLWS